MATRLLDRQIRLLDYLTSGVTIFGEGEDAPLAPALRGIDRRLLRLEARFSHEKRMEKIIAALPRTFRRLGADRAAIVRAFVEACPPTDITRVENARQFYDFLCGRWRQEPPRPPYLPDIAACEFAIAGLRSNIKATLSKPTSGDPPRVNFVRRHRNVVLLRCAYDVRPIFEGGHEQALAVKRHTRLAFAILRGVEQPRIFELLPPIFDVLGALDDWTDRSVLGTAPELDELIGELQEHGLIEMSR
jgi:hypothetical protein